MRKRVVFDYIKAATNLYGVANKNLVIQIYNSQNPDDVIDVAEFDEWIAAKSLKNSFLSYDGESFIHSVVSEYNLLDYIRHSQVDKPYYVPEQQSLLVYKDEKYVNRNQAFLNFKDYMITSIGLSEEQAEEYTVNAYFNVRRRMRMQEIMANLSVYGIKLTNGKLDHYMQNLAVFMNHVRRWENGGLMPIELANTGYHAYKNSAKGQTSVAAESTPQAPVRVSTEVGRNDLCYCGSGKKYKKCHGAN